ncbi:MAG: hypothetical protein [Bacteriophage sp.]|nr:MAG: hypothetical protein [Bacteriophage sp.]
MGLTYAFNELLSCILTGLSAAIFLGFAARLGWLPMLYITTEDPTKDQEEE